MHSALIHTVEESTSAQAWLKSAQLLLRSPERTIYNLVVGISDPITLSQADRRVVEAVDSFLMDRDCLPVVTVMNTIFPGASISRGEQKLSSVIFRKPMPSVGRNWAPTLAACLPPLGARLANVCAYRS